MTGAEVALPGEPSAAESWWAALGPRSRIVWYVVAALGSVPALVLLAVTLGWPDTLRDTVAYAAPVILAAAVLVARWRPAVGLLTLIVAAATVLPVAFATPLVGGSAAGSVASILVFSGVCWVTCVTGFHLRPAWSVPLMMVWAAVVLLRLSDESVPLLLCSVGWWVVGVVLRSREHLLIRLRARAEELAAEQDRYAAEAVRLERARLARELHDVVAHGMTVIVIQAQAGRQLLTETPTAAAEALDAITQAASEARDDIAALVRFMDPDPVRPLTPEVLADLVARAAATRVTVTVDLTGDLTELDPVLSAATHRAIQEALTNAFRHAPGSAIRIALATAPYALEVANGPPTAPPTLSETGAGRGLAGLTTRLAGAGRSVVSGPTTDGGWRLRVS